jgi:hypothetical protein
MPENEMTVDRFKSLFHQAAIESVETLLEQGHEIDIVSGTTNLDFSERIPTLVDNLSIMAWEGGPIVMPYGKGHLMIASRAQIEAFDTLYQEGAFNA